jgi:hypothetical protein
MSIPSDTIALPIVKGLDVNTDARLVNPPALLEAVNTRISGGGAKKRKGHTSLLVRGEGEVPLADSDATWVFGLGITETALRGVGEEDESYWRAANPKVGALHGVFTRDNETVTWDGSRLFSYLPSQLESQSQTAAEPEGEAVLPSLRAVPLAKYNEHQGRAEMADNGAVRVVTWINEDSDLRYALYDSVSSVLITQGSLSVTTARYSRTFSLGDWLHIAVLDDGDGRLKLFSINSTEPYSVTYRSYGDASHFDLFKVSETEAVVASTSSLGIKVTWISAVGAGSPTRAPILHVPPGGTTATLVAVAVGPYNDIAIAWRASGSGTVKLALYNANGVLVDQGASTWSDVTYSNALRFTLAPHFSQTSGAKTIWELFLDQGHDISAQRFWLAGSTLTLGSLRTRYGQILASRAFYIGDRVFFWSAFPSTLQATWLLLDEGLKPVGHMDFGVAAYEQLDGRVAGVNFTSQYEIQCALNYKLRVAPKDSTLATSGIYTEASIKGVYLDFLPTLATAQAGRTTYIAGAQLWSYDGQELTEAGFHVGPEPTLTQGAGGTLTALGTYSYRVDLCYRNAQNEEIRSLSILSESVELTGGNQKINLIIPTLPTRRDNAYFLVYRNAMSSGTPLTEWWLLNSRDPADASFLLNDLSVSSVSYLDDGSVDDTEIQTRELHPATDTYLQPIAAPACEVIASGRDRLWVSGGELPPGVVAPSRLFDPMEVPSFNAYLNIQVDRAVQPITAIGFVGEVAVFFRESSTHMLDSDGPDNVAQGFWNPPRLALSDTGAVSQASVARISAGLVFQSTAGIRLLGPGGSLSPIGTEVDNELRDFEIVGALVNEREQEVRFYGTASTYVFNYLYNSWSYWTCGGVGVAHSGSTVLARSDGHLWIEDDVWRDGDATYTHRIRTGWLHAGNLGDFQRVRWVGGLGRYADLDNPAHTLRVEIFYDERAFWEERIEWAPMDTSNQDTWGAATWGDGIWGDTGATIDNLDDLTWEWDRRPSRQKCSVFSLALEDVNTDGPGFELSAFTFDLARKSGLDRTQDRGGSGTYRS